MTNVAGEDKIAGDVTAADLSLSLTYEDEHVHQVYEEIASHFSRTRYKAWPVVDGFLRSLPAGSIGLDIGCGNGKYLAVTQDVFIVASDRSKNLVSIAQQHQPHSAIVADSLNLPHPTGSFDFAICIAVIHHLSTPERRVQAVGAILETLRPPSPNDRRKGRCDDASALIFVWALEQKNSRRGWDEGHEQDVLVPWVRKAAEPDMSTNTHAQTKEQTFQRYYHLYRKGELEADINAAGGVILRTGYDRDNWWAIAKRKNYLKT